MGIRKEKRKNMNCCPECGSKSITCTKEEDKFLYGKGKDEIELSVSADIWTCDECCSSWIGCDAMEKRVSRSPGRFAFYVDTGDLPPAEAMAQVKKVKQSYKKRTLHKVVEEYLKKKVVGNVNS
jgi:hypothetical protein